MLPSNRPWEAYGEIEAGWPSASAFRIASAGIPECSSRRPHEGGHDQQSVATQTATASNRNRHSYRAAKTTRKLYFYDPVEAPDYFSQCGAIDRQSIGGRGHQVRSRNDSVRP